MAFKWCTATAVTIIALVLGCRESEKGRSPRCTIDNGDLRPTTGGAGSAEFERDCTEDWECPRGTTCDNTKCKAILFEKDDDYNLIAGFGVQEAELHVAATEPETQYAVTLPSGSRTVVCGLFVATPSVDGEEVGRIVNDWKALNRTHVYAVSNAARGIQTPDSLRFAVSDLSDAHKSADCQFDKDVWPRPEAVTSDYPIVTTLQIACWIYGVDHVVAATRLRHVELSELAEAQPVVNSCVSGNGSDLTGRYCLSRATLGTCERTGGGGQSGENDEGGGGAAGGTATLEWSCSTSGGEGGSDGSNAPRNGGGADAAPLQSIAGASDKGSEQTEVPIGALGCAAVNTEGRSCVQKPEYTGRCVGDTCLKVESSTDGSDLPLVVLQCFSQEEQRGDAGSASGAGPGPVTDWLNCRDQGILGYGTCNAGRCRMRCVTNSDCQLGASKSVGGPTCNHSLGTAGSLSYLGLCESTMGGTEEASQKGSN